MADSWTDEGSRIDPTKIPWRYLVLGNKGSGKSTLISMLKGTYVPEKRFLSIKPLFNSKTKEKTELINESGILHHPFSSFPGDLTFSSHPKSGGDGGGGGQPDPLIPHIQVRNAYLNSKFFTSQTIFSPGIAKKVREKQREQTPVIPIEEIKTRTKKIIWFHEVPATAHHELNYKNVLVDIICNPQLQYQPSIERDQKWAMEMSKLIRRRNKEKGQLIKKLTQEARIKEDNEIVEIESDSFSSDSDSIFEESRNSKNHSSSSEEEEYMQSSGLVNSIRNVINKNDLYFDPNHVNSDGVPLFCPGLCGIICVFRTNVLFEDIVEIEERTRTTFLWWINHEEPTLELPKEKSQIHVNLIKQIMEFKIKEEFKTRLYDKISRMINQIKHLSQIPTFKGIPIHIFFNHDSKTTVIPAKSTKFNDGRGKNEKEEESEKEKEEEEEEEEEENNNRVDWNKVFCEILQKACNMNAQPQSIFERFQTEGLMSILRGGIVLNTLIPNENSYQLTLHQTESTPIFYHSHNGDIHKHWRNYVCELNLHTKLNRSHLSHVSSQFPPNVKEFNRTLEYADQICATFATLDYGSKESEIHDSQVAIKAFGNLTYRYTFPLYHPDSSYADHYTPPPKLLFGSLQTANYGELNKKSTKKSLRSQLLFSALCYLWDWIIVHGRMYNSVVRIRPKSNSNFNSETISTRQ